MWKQPKTTVPEGSSFYELLLDIARKFAASAPLSERERELYTANVREEFLTDIVAKDILQNSGYKITPAIEENISHTAAIAKELVGGDFMKDFETDAH